MILTVINHNGADADLFKGLMDDNTFAMIPLNKKGQSMDCPGARTELLIIRISIGEGAALMAGSPAYALVELGGCTGGINPSTEAYPSGDGGLLIGTD
jgi:hypothetical protein